MAAFPEFTYVTQPIDHPELGGDRPSPRLDKGDLKDALEVLYNMIYGVWKLVEPDTAGDGDPDAVAPGDTFWDLLVIGQTTELAEGYIAGAYTVDVAEQAAWTTGEYITFNTVYRYYWDGEAWAAGQPA